MKKQREFGSVEDRAREIVKSYVKIKDEYVFDADVFNPDDERVRRIKWILDNRIEPTDKVVFVLALEVDNYRELAKILGVSVKSAFEKVKKIKNKIRTEYARLDTFTNIAVADGNRGVHCGRERISHKS